MAAEEGSTPKTVEDALANPKAAAWSAAIEAELNGIEKHETWELVEPPPGANIIKCRYVFKVKRDAVGAIAKFKARLVAKGFTQIFGIDYFDTYAPVVKLETLRALLSLAASKGSIIHQADVKNAYLNAELKEDLYMELPPHYDEFRTLPPKIQALRDAGRRIVVKLCTALNRARANGIKSYHLSLRHSDTRFAPRTKRCSTNILETTTLSSHRPWMTLPSSLTPWTPSS